jgi:hypothetical protein
MLKILNAVLFILVGFCLCQYARCDTMYLVNIDTAPLIGHPAAPFFFGAVFIDGSGIGDANNTVTLSNFDFHGGASVSSPLLLGGASGSLSTTTSIIDSSSFNLFEQEFSPGVELTFNLDLTSNDDVSGTPDRLTLYILDNSGNPLPTLAPTGDYLLGADLGSAGPVLDFYGTDPSRSPSEGNPLAIPAPTVAPTGIVPEPAPIVLLGSIILITLMLNGPRLASYFN